MCLCPLPGSYSNGLITSTLLSLPEIKSEEGVWHIFQLSINPKSYCELALCTTASWFGLQDKLGAWGKLVGDGVLRIGEIKDEPGNRGSTLGACVPRGCWTSCLWPIAPSRCALAGWLGAREAIKDPLKFALLLPERSSTAITASSTRKTQGDKRRCPGFKGVV